MFIIQWIEGTEDVQTATKEKKTTLKFYRK